MTLLKFRLPDRVSATRAGQFTRAGTICCIQRRENGRWVRSSGGKAPLAGLTRCALRNPYVRGRRCALVAPVPAHAASSSPVPTHAASSSPVPTHAASSSPRAAAVRCRPGWSEMGRSANGPDLPHDDRGGAARGGPPRFQYAEFSVRERNRSRAIVIVRMPLASPVPIAALDNVLRARRSAHRPSPHHRSQSGWLCHRGDAGQVSDQRRGWL